MDEFAPFRDRPGESADVFRFAGVGSSASLAMTLRATRLYSAPEESTHSSEWCAQAARKIQGVKPSALSPLKY
jgi:hypothetical protein